MLLLDGCMPAAALDGAAPATAQQKKNQG